MLFVLCMLNINMVLSVKLISNINFSRLRKKENQYKIKCIQKLFSFPFVFVFLHAQHVYVLNYVCYILCSRVSV